MKFAVDSVSQDGADAEPDTASSPTPSSDKKESKSFPRGGIVDFDLLDQYQI